jgi:AAA+ ATPase superfamily predicted ATPase
MIWAAWMCLIIILVNIIICNIINIRGDSMKRFVNRGEELGYLNSEYAKEDSSLVILYGRRRTGKTALISQFGFDKNMLYFFSTEESENENRNTFKNLVANFLDNELLKKAIIEDWDILFKELVKYKPNKKKLIVIDEFQYLGKANKSFPSIFQRIWDTILKNENIMVILCGSLVSLMEEQTLSYSSPLYGRRTGQIKLGQIKFRNYHEFFLGKERKELIKYYSVTGGVPKYIELFDDSNDIFSAIEKNVLSPQSFLYEEPVFLLQKEVTEIGSYFSIIKTIAAGNHKLSKISASLGVKQTNLSTYLKTLIDLDIVEREIPITEENPLKSKRGHYIIKDNFILFWFKFIYPYKSFIEQGNTEVILDKIKKNIMHSHISYVYEDVCIETMWEFNKENTWGFNFNRAGRWWNNTTEIDIVAYDSNRTNVIYGECKFTEKPMDVDVYYELVKKAKEVNLSSNASEHFILFSINGFSDQLVKLAKENPTIILSR